MTKEKLDKIAKRYAQDELKDNHGQVEDIVAAAFLNGIDYAEHHPRWISVEDELPPLEIVSESWETSDDVLVYTLSGDMLVSRYEFSKLTKEHYWIFSDHDYIVTHWMPLPAPPAKLSSLERNGKKWKGGEQ